MNSSALKKEIGKRASRATAILALFATSLLVTTTGLAQMPKSPWKMAAPFPEPDEELDGVACNGKMYVIGGWKDGNARGANYEYDPTTDKWTKKGRPGVEGPASSYASNSQTN